MYAALFIPRFALQATLRAREASPDAPFALVSDSETQARVLQVTRAAEQEGVFVGLTVAQALARCSELTIVYRTVQAEEVAWQLARRAAYSLSPRVEDVSEGFLLVDLRGRVLQEVRDACLEMVPYFAQLGFLLRIGLAPAYGTALLAAKHAKGLLEIGEQSANSEACSAGFESESNNLFLSRLPIEAMEPSSGLLEILRQWGLKSVAAFAALKRSGVASRLGMEGLVLWDRVNGKDTRVIAVVDLPLDFEVSWEFESAVDSLEPLLFLMRRFLDQLCFEMRATHKVAEVLTLELGLSYGEPLFVTQKIPEPSCDVEALFRILSGQLDSLEVDSAVDRFSIRIDAVDFKQRQYGLFDASLKNPNRLGQTLAKIAGIVGADRIGRPVLLEDGRPDGFRMEELARFSPPEVEAVLESHYVRPLRRFRPGVEVTVKLQAGRPVWLRCQRVSGFINSWQGPWVQSGHWWEADASWSRVEWDVALRDGGVYRLVRERGRWVLEGEYD